MPSIFQLFVREFWQHSKDRYSFVQKLEKAFDVSIPKASSFYLGKSPTYGKHVIVSFQPSSKVWEAGEFTINVHISAEFEPTDSNWQQFDEPFQNFDDGFYRLSNAAGVGDRWWCLQPRDPEFGARDNTYGQYWEPPSFVDKQQVLSSCVESVCRFLEERLFQKAGFTSPDPTIRRT